MLSYTPERRGHINRNGCYDVWRIIYRRMLPAVHIFTEEFFPWSIFQRLFTVGCKAFIEFEKGIETVSKTVFKSPGAHSPILLYVFF